MTAFLVSLVLTLALCGVIPFYARRRPAGTPLTWGEAFVAATFVFAIFVLAYGILPHQWLVWCDKELSWRADKTGIPLGPLANAAKDPGRFPSESFGIQYGKGVLFPNGVTFNGRGRVILNAEHIRDVVGATIYIIALVGHCYLWALWQKRGQVAKAKAEREALSSSAYGRPLKRAEA